MCEYSSGDCINNFAKIYRSTRVHLFSQILSLPYHLYMWFIHFNYICIYIFMHLFSLFHCFSLHIILTFYKYFTHHMDSFQSPCTKHTQLLGVNTSYWMRRSMSCSCILTQFQSLLPSDWPIHQHGARRKILGFTRAYPGDVMVLGDAVTWPG